MEEVRRILEEIFRIKRTDINFETKMEDIDSWDSLTHMEMIVELEDTFGIEFTADEIMEMTIVGKIEEIVRRKRDGN